MAARGTRVEEAAMHMHQPEGIACVTVYHLLLIRAMLPILPLSWLITVLCHNSFLRGIIYSTGASKIRHQVHQSALIS